jgi:hypothetical protein
MTEKIKDFIDEHDLDAQDVIGALDLEVPDGPTAFYDDEPDVETLAEDFDAVDLLVDKKEDLEAQIETQTDELYEYRKEAFADRAADLAELTDKWGDEETLVEKYEDDDNEEFESIDDLESKIDLVKEFVDDEEETTTVDDENEGGEDEGLEAPTTKSGGFDLRKNTKLD